MGFEQADFIDSFSSAGRIRNYVSDAAAFDYIIKSYEEKEAGKPLFFFEVTMQNHSGYTEEFANFTPDITINGTDSQSLSQYLSLIKESDKALEELVNYFSEQEEKTVIVFFGDHQPADFVVEPILQLQGRSGSSLTEAEQAQRYEVPFLIWANYDIEEAQKVEISANYLSGLVLEAAGVPLPVYQTYLEELRQTVPVLSAQWMVTAGGYVGLPDEQEDVLSQYRKMQYYLLFDSE